MFIFGKIYRPLSCGYKDPFEFFEKMTKFDYEFEISSKNSDMFYTMVDIFFT